MAMTEKQGGSDVRANTTAGDHMGGHAYSITGHKWFCSAPMSDGFLVLARTRRGSVDEALSCLFVPRLLPNGMRNAMRIQRLKDKLGNRSNASAEVEFDGTVGTVLGEPGRGVRTIIEMVQRTRLDCVLGTAAGMRQSVAEAVWHARGRSAFGALLVDQPAMTAVLADLALEYEAAMLTGLRLAQSFESAASDRDVAFCRLATPVAKYWNLDFQCGLVGICNPLPVNPLGTSGAAFATSPQPPRTQALGSVHQRSTPAGSESHA